MASSIDQIIPKCRKCDKIISLRIDRIKKHFLKCPGPVIIYMDVKCMEDHDKIGDDKGKTLKDFKKGSDTTTSSDELEKWKDSDHTAPIKRYGVSSDKWDKRYGVDSGKSYPNEYMDGIIDYEKYPHKRHRSESEESDESPAYKRANIGNRSVKRQRSETDSDLSDDPPLSKRYKIDVQGGKKEDGYDTDDENSDYSPDRKSESDLSDDPPLSKRYKKNTISGGRWDGFDNPNRYYGDDELGEETESNGNSEELGGEEEELSGGETESNGNSEELGGEEAESNENSEELG